MLKFLEKPVNSDIKRIKIRDLVIALIILLAILSRVIGLGDRVMSHDEVNHVVPAFDLFSGRGYRHDPVTHGPLQFHLMALSYFLFGDNDFTSRLPHALFSIATIVFVTTYFRRYLGKFGSIAAGVLFTISPFMLFYGRYARNDTICVFLGITAIYGLLRYFESSQIKYLYYFTAMMALNFTTKETAYILTAQLLIFLFIIFIRDFLLIKGVEKINKRRVILMNIILIAGISAAVIASVLLFKSSYATSQNSGLLTLANGQLPVSFNEVFNSILSLLIFAGPGLVPLILGILFLLFLRKQLKWELLEESHSFNMLILLSTLVLPLLAPFLVRFAGMDPSAYSNTLVLLTNYIYIGFFLSLSYIIGSLWNQDHWWKLALTFYGIYIIFSTTFFTNSVGLLTGMVGSLGHWLNQQSVHRGGQPTYYYALILIPIYEFLSAFGTILAFYIGIKQKTFLTTRSGINSGTQTIKIKKDVKQLNEMGNSKELAILPNQDLIPNPAIYIFLVITSLIAFSIAGEKMPWLSLHIVFPMLLASAWAIEQLISRFVLIYSRKENFFHAGIFACLINSLLLFVQVLGNQAPFQGKTQNALQNTNHFLFLAIIEIGLIVLLAKVTIKKKVKKIKYSLIIGIFLLMILITSRSSYR
ncbi:MAG: TIGR03663 family protein, partial [Anaerolineaceae bacterium]|nr:TIGR03663 family protein [Anaerolineaceae bacterium]